MGWLQQTAETVRDFAAAQSWLGWAQPMLNAAPDWALVGGPPLLAFAAGAAATSALQRMRGDRWDVFVSYKSENVELARRIAERLIASGLKVWFAEYQVLLAERERFQEAIDKGLARSRYGIVLTNELYAMSQHCMHELAGLLDRCGPARLLEVRVPPGAAGTKTVSHSIEYAGDVDAVLGFIGQTAGWTVVAAPRPGGTARKLHEGECLGIPYSIDVSGWFLVDPSFQGGGPCYQHEQHRLIWNVQYGRDRNPNLYDARRGWTSSNFNDRALFDEMCAFARGHLAEPIGAHLFLHDGAAHFAATYRKGRQWKRVYSVMLVEPQTYEAAEFLFTFQFEGPFEHFCLMGDTMEALVGSLTWRAPNASLAAPSRADERLVRVSDDLPAANKLMDEGMTLMKSGRLAEGVEALKRVLDYNILAEMRGQVLFNIGLAQERIGDPDAAMQSYRASVEANPAQFNAYCNLGNILYRRGDVQAALASYLMAAEINATDYITANNIAVCYDTLKDRENADKWQATARALKS
jgi:tetratricopeptide (TPR) repeat protein